MESSPQNCLLSRYSLFSSVGAANKSRYHALMSAWDFSAIAAVEPDPLFGIAALAKAAGPDAIDGTLGIYLDEQARPVLFPSVKMALTDLAEHLPSLNYSYPPLAGLPEFRTAVTSLIFDDPSALHIASIAATAGTGALAMNLRLAKLMQPEATVVLQMPAWGNHPPLILANALHVTETQYVGSDGKPDTEPIANACEQATRPIILLLQVGCHNPTGLDFIVDQWKEIAAIATRFDCLVLLDFAYQGFKGTPEEDRKVINYFIQTSPLLIAWSASKNHSIYGMRCGFSCAIAPDRETQAKLEILYSRITRGMTSAAPTFGQMIVALVQSKYRNQWLADLKGARETMTRKRQLLRDALPERFHPSLAGFGMFAMLPLTLEQIKTLRTDHKVFFTDDGRINIAGIPVDRMAELCEKIQKVCGD